MTSKSKVVAMVVCLACSTPIQLVAQQRPDAVDSPVPPTTTKPVAGGLNPEKTRSSDQLDQAVSPLEANPKTAGKTGTPNFVDEVAVSNLANLQAAQLAAKRSTSDPVKQLAAMMASDYTKLAEDIRQLAAKQKIKNLADKLDEQRRVVQSRLESTPVTEFDKRFLQQSIHDHESLIAFLQQKPSSATAASAADFTAFSTAALPVLNRHLVDAQALLATQK